MKTTPCPILEKTNLLMCDLEKTLRRLEANAKVCEVCFSLPNCAITSLLARAIRRATEELIGELGGWHG
jgi:hypothetical protein